MTDPDPKLPDPAGASTPPPAPPGTPAGAADPGAGAPEVGGSPSESGAADGIAGAPGTETTTQMPVTGADPAAAAAGGVPPVGPDDTGLDGDGEVPWYKKPAGIAAIAVLALALFGLIIWLIWGGGDDDDASPETSRLTIETRDETGALLDRGFLINVVGPAGAERSYTWLLPDDATPGETTGAETGTDGRVDFEWEPDETVDDPAAWAATVDLVESIPPGWTPPGPIVECALERVDEADSVVSMAVEIVENNDPEADQLVAYTFPNYSFVPGDAVRCNLTSTTPVETTTTTTTTTTTSTTTTVVDTTVPEDTTTTVVETTVETTAPPETTVAPTTTLPVVTVPPQPQATLWDVIDNSPDLSALKALIDVADPAVREALENPDATITLFAPSNTAIENAANIVPPPDLTDPAVVTPILLAHVDNTEVLLLADVLALPSVPVAEGGPQPVDAAAQTVGGASVLVADVTAVNGVIHVIDAVMPIQPV